MRVIFVSLLLACISIVKCSSNQRCVPAQDGFEWKPKCRSTTVRDQKVKLNKLEAYQDGKRILKAVSLSKLLTLEGSIDYSYGKLIKDNRYDFTLYHYRNEGEGCQWYREDEVAEETSNIDACTMIKKNCAYAGKPTNVTAYIDIKKVLGVFEDLVIYGDYYGIDVCQRDGPTKLTCFWMQNQMVA